MKKVGMILAFVILILSITSAIGAKDNAKDNGTIFWATKASPSSSLIKPPAELGFIRNDSSPTLCAEEDNINIPLYYQNLTSYKITATHPTYILTTNVTDKGLNCTNCDYTNFTTEAEKIYDDGNVVIETVIERPWWRSRAGMSVSINGGKPTRRVTYFRIYKYIPGTFWDYPQIFVLYEDGNARIIPQPPVGIKSVTFGSSVILGATGESTHHFVDIDLVDIDPANLSMDIKYDNKTAAHAELHVNRTENVVKVLNITYDTSNHPFARLRSMWVTDGNSDTDHIRTDHEEYPILGDFSKINGTWWQFFRKVPSIHNTYCPDIKIEVTPETHALGHNENAIEDNEL